MHHREEVLHAFHVARRLKEKSHAGEYGPQAQLIKVSTFPTGAVRNGISVLLGDTEKVPCRIVSDQFVK